MVIGVGCYLRRENTGLLFVMAKAVIAIRRLWLAKEKGVVKALSAASIRRRNSSPRNEIFI